MVAVVVAVVVVVVVVEVTVFAVVVIAMIVAVTVVVVVEITVFAVVVVDMHAVGDIDPEDPVNMLTFLSFEFTQETPQSVWSKDVASWNIWLMSVTADTFHTDRSWLKECAL